MSPIPIKITNAVDVLELVPSLIGFYPTESLVAIAFNDTGSGLRIALTARGDLPTSDGTIRAGIEDLAELEGRYAALILVAYSVDLEHARTAVQTLLKTSTGKVLSVIIASAQGWTTVDPKQSDYVGWTNPYPTTTGPAAAAAAEAGLYAYGTRDDVTESVAAPDAQTVREWEEAWVVDQVPTEPTPEQAATMVEDLRTYLAEYAAAPFTVTVEDAAWLTAHVQLGKIRDAALVLVDRDNAMVHANLWREVAALAPDREAVLPVLGLLALTAWIGGNGTLQNVAIERGQTIPGGRDYRLLVIAAGIVDKTLPPSLWDAMRNQLIRDL